MSTIPLSVYTRETRYAVETLLHAIRGEHEQATSLAKELTRLDARLEAEYRASFLIAVNATNAEDYMFGVGRGVDAHFGEESRARYEVSGQLREIDAQLQVHLFSIRALAGSILQLGKQGISLAYSKPANCPPGRDVAGVSLRTVIWEGRNQAMHWEDLKSPPPMRECFETLARQNPVFREYERRNLALEVVGVLGWHALEVFENDLLSLQG